MSVYDRFNRLLQGRAPIPRANIMRPYQTLQRITPPMALPRPAPPQSPMLANQQLSPLMQRVLRNAQASRLTPKAGQVGLPTPETAASGQPAPEMTFGQKLMQPRTQGMLGASAAGFEASGYQDRPVSLGQVLGRMGTAGTKSYAAAEDRIAAQKAASQKSVIDRLLAEAQYAKATRPDTTSLLKNLAAAGIDPNSPEGQKIIRDALTKPGTTIMTGGEGEFIKEGVKSGFKILNEAQKQVETDRSFSTRLQQVIDILSDPNAKTGPIASATMGIRQIGRELGFLNEEQEKTLNSQQVLSAAINYMTPKMRVSGSGSSSDKDVELMQDALPTLSGSPQGNRLIAALYKKTLDYNKKRVGLMGQYLKKEKNLIGFGDWADEKMGALYVRIGSQDDINNAVNNGTLKDGDVYWNDGAKEFQILVADD